MIKAKEVLNLVEDICNYYNMEVIIKKDCSILQKNLEDGKTIGFCNVQRFYLKLLQLMKETNENIFATGDVDTIYNTWSKKDLDTIDSLSKNANMEMEEEKADIYIAAEKYKNSHIKTFVENYDITLEEAKKSGTYRFSIIENAQLKEWFNGINIFEDDEDEVECGVVKRGIVILEFGNIDIELNLFKDNSKTTLYYYVCTKGITEDGQYVWDSFDETGNEIQSEDEIDNLEKAMFQELIRFIKFKKLSWSIPN